MYLPNLKRINNTPSVFSKNIKKIVNRVDKKWGYNEKRINKYGGLLCTKKIVPGKKAVYGHGNEKGLFSNDRYPNNPDYEFFFLEEFVVPDTVKQKLGAYYAFNGTTVIIPDRIEELKDFSSDTLKSITFPKNLKKINGNYGEGFSYCRNLTEIIIPDEIKQIEFDWCSFKGTHLTLKTQAKLKELGYTGSF